MKRIAVTQRVDVIHAYGERRDALDQRWAPLLRGLDLACFPVPNDPASLPAWLAAVEPDAVLLSGGNSVGAGPDQAPERDATEAALIEWARVGRRPLVGICRGMQMLNVHLGGTLAAVSGHVAVRHDVAARDGIARSVNSFHNFGIAGGGLAIGLDAVEFAPDGTVESCAHRELPWRAVMWHPEREPRLEAADRRMLLDVLGASR